MGIDALWSCILNPEWVKKGNATSVLSRSGPMILKVSPVYGEICHPAYRMTSTIAFLCLVCEMLLLLSALIMSTFMMDLQENRNMLKGCVY